MAGEVEPLNPINGRMTRFKRGVYPYALLSPSLLALLLVGMYPFVYMIILSFRKIDFRKFGTAGEFAGFENYRNLFSEPVFLTSLKTTAFIVLTSVPIELVLGFGIAYLFNRNFPLKRLAVTVTIIPTVLAPIAIAVMWKILLATPWGVLDLQHLSQDWSLYRDVHFRRGGVGVDGHHRHRRVGVDAFHVPGVSGRPRGAAAKAV